ncbi:hypothetical protein HJC23_013482 [Cyclotella cryptica]|uniref:AFG1-like ATPase n=1 Tax=Cyclotella cryptica TaxID=29204 RepID=A0ABD3QBV2_9STRA|eukprot:CCRYP_006889-RA/>CCRYP_006889-RA protein AED:0.21 eAED:0.21 QI:0/-1/0/1/-1/1/1/0/494
MPFHRSATAFQQRIGGPITLAYKRHVQSGRIHPDNDQLSLGAALDSLYFHLSSPTSERFLIPDHHLDQAARYYAGSSSLSLEHLPGIAIATAHSFVHSSPKGIYIHGSVGVGKSMLMDLFYQTCHSGMTEDQDHAVHYKPIQRKCMRCHFHEFMLDVHQRIHFYKARHPRADPIPPVAAALAKEARLLCFDEMQITDIADAMILKRLLTLLFDLGVTVVTTSNRPPCGLYEGGINRSVFLPFIDKLKERMTVIEMGGMRDYRRDALFMTSESNEDLIPSYVCPSNGPTSLKILEQWYSAGRGETRSEVIPVAMGRSIRVQKANDSCGWFSFDELCKQPLGAADYIAIAKRFSLVIIENVPQLGGNTYNEARRFVILIDALYEAKTKLVVSSNVPRDHLFVGFDATVETNDGDEEIAIDGNRFGKESLVVGEGGSSSSSSTTLIRTANDGVMEWSATGRIGVSLAQLSAVKEVSFSFQRAASRLAEMTASNWGRA